MSLTLRIGLAGNGTLACSEAGYWCDQALILDGTWPFRAMDSHLGQLWLHLEIQGEAAASCSCARATNPIDVAMARLQRMDDAVNALISPDPLRREFFGHERIANTLYCAVKPDPAALEFAGRVACLTARVF